MSVLDKYETAKSTLSEELIAELEKRYPHFIKDKVSDYVLLDVLVVDHEFIDRIRDCSRRAYDIYKKVTDLIRTYPDDILLGMGIPENTLGIVRMAYKGLEPCVVGRFDFILTEDGPKVIEFNAQTPYILCEGHRICGDVVSFSGFLDPNEHAEAYLESALSKAVLSVGENTQFVVTGHSDKEDDATARYATTVAERAGKNVRFAPIQNLRLQDDGLYDSVGKIDLLYSFYPLELFSLDSGGPKLFKLIEDQKLTIINPPLSLIMQTKATMAFIWAFYERGLLFTDEEKQDVEKIFLPTYALLPDDFLEYVEKPVLGREGNTVSIIRRNGDIDRAKNRTFSEQGMVYQRRVDIPTIVINTLRGAKTCHAITTCFVVNGQPTAVQMRVGNEITDVNAHCLPLALKT